MLRPKQNPTYSSETGKLWAKNWSKVPKSGKTSASLKNALVRYPKSLKSIKSIVTTLAFLSCDRENISLWKRVLSKYKGRIHSCLNFSLLQPSDDEQSPNFIRSLKTKFQERDRYEDIQMVEGFNLRGKRMQTVETRSNAFYSEPRVFFRKIKQIRKNVAVKHLILDSIPALSLTEYRNLLFASKNHLQHLVFEGPLEYGFRSHDFLGLIRLSLQLPNLKSFRFNLKCPHNFSVNDFPFEILQRRKINYDVRLIHYAETPLSQETLDCLSDLEYLSINTIHKFEYLSRTEFEFEVQNGVNRLLFLNVFDNFAQKCFDPQQLLKACQNISVLHFCLDSNSLFFENFTKLPELPNLQHVILRLQGDLSFQGLFDSLTAQAQKYKTLKSFVLKLGVKQWDVDLSPFFEACAETVQDISLQVFNCHLFTDHLDSFYQCFGKIQNLTSLSLEFYKWEIRRSPNFPPQNGFLYFTRELFHLIEKQTQLQKLQIHLAFSIEFQEQVEEIAFKLPPSIKDFSLSLRSDWSVFAIEKMVIQATKLERFALQTKFNPLIFGKLLNSLGDLKELEVLELSREAKENIIKECQVLHAVMPKLKYLIFADHTFVRSMGLWKNMDELI